MFREEEEDTATFNVVVNHEEQYSIWPQDREIPLGWKAVGKSGLKAICLEFINEVWTDMRPLSLRKEMAEMEARRPELEAEEARRIEEESKKPQDPRNDIVSFLCDGDHPVEVSLRPEKTAKAMKESVDRGYIHLKFTDTRGGTELGVEVDAEASDLSRADFGNESG